MQEFSDMFNKILHDNTIPKRLAEGIGVGIAPVINIITQSNCSKIILFQRDSGTNGAMIYSLFQDETNFSAFIDQCIATLTEYQKETARVKEYE